jgi:hypothetical protein
MLLTDKKNNPGGSDCIGTDLDRKMKGEKSGDENQTSYEDVGGKEGGSSSMSESEGMLTGLGLEELTRPFFFLWG